MAGLSSASFRTLNASALHAFGQGFDCLFESFVLNAIDQRNCSGSGLTTNTTCTLLNQNFFVSLQHHKITKCCRSEKGKSIGNLSLFVSLSADQLHLLANVSLNLTKNLQRVTEVLPEEKVRVEANIPFLRDNANLTSVNFDFQWEISTIDEDTGQFFPLVVLADKDRNITISSLQVPVGFTFIRVSAVPKNAKQPMSYDFGFIRILPRLQASVNGPAVAIKGDGPVLLNSIISGELSDSFGNKADKLTFLWSCQVENSRSSNLAISSESRYDNLQTNASCECFDPGILNSTREQSLSFNPDLLIANKTYIFHILVSQGRRFVTASHKIRVDSNISLSIR